MPSSYTPGPWEVVTPPRGAAFGVGHKVEWAQGMKYTDTLVCQGSDKSNARLIAAAPELLEALKLVVDIASHECASVRMAKVAIAKAEGREVTP